MKSLLGTVSGWLASFVLVAAQADKPTGTIAFASQTPRGWDIYTSGAKARNATRLTDHPAVDCNAAASPDGKKVAFVSVRDGNMEIYSMNAAGSDAKRLTNEHALDDHPSWSPDGKQLVFTSTREASGRPSQGWNALYLMNADGSGVKRLSPSGVTDYSPVWSPGRDCIAFVSEGQGICVVKPDGSGRKVLAPEGGWPAFAGDGAHVYFHKRDGNRWGIWQARLDGSNLQLVSPADQSVCTPAGSASSNKLAVAVLRPSGRQIECLDLDTGRLTPVTDESTDHWNPSLSPDGEQVYFHKTTPGLPRPRIDWWSAPEGTDLQMFRMVDAMFPCFSADGKRIAFIDGLFDANRRSLAIINSDGTDYRRIWSGNTDLFGLSWTHANDLLTFSRGGFFRDAGTEIDVATVLPDGTDLKTLIADGSNNGWLSFAPDDKQFVFRSGRSRAKNLYIADRDGSNIQRLTEGNWTDTMPHWSPTGQWIVFASNRGGQFGIWLIKPDGSGLRKLFGEAMSLHPHFSPDERWVVFTSAFAGTSVEAISLPRTDEPFGDLFAIRVDGTGLIRLTHNGSSDGTPDWGPSLPHP